MITNPILGKLGIPGQKGGITIEGLFPPLVSLALVIGVLIFFFILITGAIQWISSGGDKQNVEAARGRITSALVGLVILFVVFAVARLIENFFGIHILTLDISNLIIK